MLAGLDAPVDRVEDERVAVDAKAFDFDDRRADNRARAFGAGMGGLVRHHLGPDELKQGQAATTAGARTNL